MKLELTPEQREARAAFRAFSQSEVAPYAEQWDREEALSPEIVRKLAARGWLGSIVPVEHGGPGMDMITYGLLTEELGRGCSSTRSLLTVHDMVAQGLVRWGSRGQREHWLPKLVAGEVLGAFALSEPTAGSDAKGVQTTAEKDGDGYVINGRKKWITFAQIADLFLVFLQCEGKPTAFLIERTTPGLRIEPIKRLLGTRASMLGEMFFENCKVPVENMVGRPGFGVSHVVAAALEQGRYSVACGSVGIAQACLDACLAYAKEREQFGKPIFDHQLVRALLSEMIVQVRAARLMCLRAGWLRQSNDPGAFMETMAAKYLASTVAAKAAADAVQIHGANGCIDGFAVSRYFRDAKVMEIIEGSSQIQQMTIARFDFQEL
ncbi:MAG TPA: acyl-CoA dehydrogenase [Acidobacteria bacterium]|nr:acyl-CoA dehydrogenase [Acidobacteriota bacterium]